MLSTHSKGIHSTLIKNVSITRLYITNKNDDNKLVHTYTKQKLFVENRQIAFALYKFQTCVISSPL